MGTGAWVGIVVGTVAMMAGAFVLFGRADTLKGSDLGAVRQEALSLFPRGSRVKDAKNALVAKGFQCYPIEHNFPNVNGPSLTCNSNGRNFPSCPGLSITVSGRNGIVSEIEVWNLFGDARQDPRAPLSGQT